VGGAARGWLVVRVVCARAPSLTSVRGSRVGSEACDVMVDVHSRTGGVHVIVPSGRYQVDAQSGTGAGSIRRLFAAESAPFRSRRRAPAETSWSRVRGDRRASCVAGPARTAPSIWPAARAALAGHPTLARTHQTESARLPPTRAQPCGISDA